MAENTGVLEIAESNETGTITFADEVIATIASLAACEVKGVSGMSGNVANGFATLLGLKSTGSKGVKVEVGTKETAIDCSIIVKYGSKVQQVASEVQSNIKSAVENMTGLTVVQANVSIVGIETKEPAPAKPEKKEPEEKTPRVK